MLVLIVRILEGMFVVGSAGCALVLILTSIDDLRVLFSANEKGEKKQPLSAHHEHMRSVEPV
jgi:hypothetical protein